GLILSNGLPVEKEPLDTLVELTVKGKPSITYKGSIPPLIDPEPRIWMLNPLPGVPVVCLTLTPANCPTIAWSTLRSGRSSTFRASKDDTAPVTFLLFCVP